MSKLARCALLVACGPFVVVVVAGIGAAVTAFAICLLLRDIAEE